MAFLGKEYKLVGSENYEGFVRSCPLPEAQAQYFLTFKPTQKLTKDGDKYTFTTTTDDGSRELVFTSGVEFTEQVGTHESKTKVIVDGNVMTQTQKFDDGNTLTFVREFNGDDLVLTLTNTAWDGVAKRFYKV